VSGFKLIEVERAIFSVLLMCRMLGVSHGNYYDGREQSPSRRSWEDTALTIQITAVIKRLDHSTVSAELEEAPRVRSADRRDHLPHCPRQCFTSSGFSFPDEIFDLGKGFLDGIEVGRSFAGRQVISSQPRPSISSRTQEPL
jgi:hypothetical protein